MSAVRIPTARPQVVCCAIYTRKSSDEGLEQSFNSLDAQREACAAYILSQASQGWSEVSEQYDDGGLSGGTLERPALQRLLADVAAGRIDIIVVYKVDRLTRSLLDFSKLIEAFDRAGVSFVSITQSFNTTTSMGRLTLNMLLSFAQFEREVTAERIRDKIAASKAKGMWMGGTPPLGYRPDGRSLAIVDEHATLVRHMFERYLVLGNVRLLETELRQQSVTVPQRSTSGGKPLGGGWFSRGLLHAMLKRVIYAGQIAHGDKTYAGNHPAIVDPGTFERVQAMLADHTQGAGKRNRVSHPSLLAGRIVDEAGEPLIATHATKGQVRYRYYVSRALHLKESATGMRVPAREIERLVTTRMAALFDDAIGVIATAWLDVPADRLAALHLRCGEIAGQLRAMNRDTVTSLLHQVQIAEGRIEVAIATPALATLLNTRCDSDAPATITLTADARLTRSGTTMKLVQRDGSTSTATPDRALLRQLVAARRWWAELRRGEIEITRLAAREKVTPSYMTRIVRLAFLSPAVVEAVLAGKQRTGVDVGRLTLDAPVPGSWREQQLLLLPIEGARG